MGLQSLAHIKLKHFIEKRNLKLNKIAAVYL